MKLFPFFRFTIHGNSMLPSLKPGQDVVVFNWAYIFSEPKIRDIVVINHQGRQIIKRISRINNHALWVRGDNEKESTDSSNFGAVEKSNIIGKVILSGS